MSRSGGQEKLLHNAGLIADRGIVQDGWLLIEDGVITDRGRGSSWRSRIGARPVETVDLAGAWLSPGFVDIHCHGAGGHAFDDGPEAALEALAVHRRHGTTSCVLSFVTDTVAAMAERLAWTARLAREHSAVLGSHAEGPFLDPGHKGAHAEQLLTAPTPDTVSRLLAAAEGTLRQITLAPELPGGMAAVRQVRASGAVVAVGHTAAGHEAATEAFDAGAGILTHAFNAMAPVHHRAPGPVVAALSRPGVFLEVICDGVHVHPEVIRMLFASAPGRTVLMTDAMSATCMPDGGYLLGSLPVTVTDGVARLTHGGSIAGSTLTMDRAVQLAVRGAGLPLEDAVYAATQAPLRALGLPADRGGLQPGMRADLVVLDHDLGVREVLVGGVPDPR